MRNFDREKTVFELKVHENIKILIVFIFLYLVGIISLTSTLLNTDKEILNLLYLMIAPISGIGWWHFANIIFDYKATIFNQFGSNRLYYWLSIFWGNKKLPVIAIVISLIMIISNFLNFFLFESTVHQNFENLKNTQQNTLQNIAQLKSINKDTLNSVKDLKLLTSELSKQNLNIIQQKEFKKINEKSNNIENLLKETEGKLEEMDLHSSNRSLSSVA